MTFLFVVGYILCGFVVAVLTAVLSEQVSDDLDNGDLAVAGFILVLAFLFWPVLALAALLVSSVLLASGKR